PVAAQQAKHSRATQDRPTSSAASLQDQSSNLSLGPNVVSASNTSLLFLNGPLRAWSDGAQLASETALVQIGMVPLGLFPVAYLAPNYSGPAAVPTRSTASVSHPQDLAANGKDLSSEMISSPLNQVYYTGEVGFLYGRST